MTLIKEKMQGDNNFKVGVLGGGLAGLTLAIQLKQKHSEMEVVVLERRKTKAKDAAHKVGESTVELGTYYLRETLGLAEYLDSNHLRKFGLRFYFPSAQKEEISTRTEFGVHHEPKVLSHQLDRGILENDLIDKAIDLGVEVKLGAKVLEIHAEDGKHLIHWEQNGSRFEEAVDWIVDASGRANILKNQWDLLKDNGHEVNAIWFRVKGEVDVDSWSSNESWNSYLGKDVRRLGTIHFMGTGYWVWIIPLASGNTSIGIVSDPRYHSLESMETKEKAFDWLKANEPQVGLQLSQATFEVLDFRKLKNYSYHCKEFFSMEQWGITGESGAFLDPFYSPGTDFIALANSWLTDLISHSYQGENTISRAITYDKVKTQLLDNWLPIYQDKYHLFGNTQLMLCKIGWDFAFYWSIPCVLFTNKVLTNMEALKAIFIEKGGLGERFRLLNANLQQFYVDWGKLEEKAQAKRYFDPLGVSVLRNFQEEMVEISPNLESLLERLNTNVEIMEKFACALFRKVQKEYLNVEETAVLNPYTMRLGGEAAPGTVDVLHGPDPLMEEEVLKFWAKA